MKKILALIGLVPMLAFGQPFVARQSYTTNSESGARTVTTNISNALILAAKTNPTFYGSAAAPVVYADSVQATNSSSLVLSGGGVSLTLTSGDIYAQLNHSFMGSGLGLTNIPGNAIQIGTVNSNRFDAATVAMFGTGGGGGTASFAIGATNVYGIGARSIRRRDGYNLWNTVQSNAPVRFLLVGDSVADFVESTRGVRRTFQRYMTNSGYGSLYTELGDNGSESGLFFYITGTGSVSNTAGYCPGLYYPMTNTAVFTTAGNIYGNQASVYFMGGATLGSILVQTQMNGGSFGTLATLVPSGMSATYQATNFALPLGNYNFKFTSTGSNNFANCGIYNTSSQLSAGWAKFTVPGDTLENIFTNANGAFKTFLTNWNPQCIFLEAKDTVGSLTNAIAWVNANLTNYDVTWLTSGPNLIDQGTEACTETIIFGGQQSNSCFNVFHKYSYFTPTNYFFSALPWNAGNIWQDGAHLGAKGVAYISSAFADWFGCGPDRFAMAGVAPTPPTYSTGIAGDGFGTTNVQSFVPTLPYSNNVQNLWVHSDLTNGNVVAWIDRVSGKNFAQATANNQPIKGANGVGFYGTNFLSHAGISAASGSTYFIAFRPRTVAAGYKDMLSDGGNNLLSVNTANLTIYKSAGYVPAVVSAGVLYDAVFSLTNAAASTGNYTFTNGVSSGVTTAGFGATTWTTMGSFAGSTEFFNGDILAVVIWTNAPAFTTYDAELMAQFRRSLENNAYAPLTNPKFNGTVTADGVSTPGTMTVGTGVFGPTYWPYTNALAGFANDGKLTNVVIGSGLTFSGNVLSGTGGGVTPTFNPNQFSVSAGSTNIISGVPLTNVLAYGVMSNLNATTPNYNGGFWQTNFITGNWDRQTNGAIMLGTTNTTTASITIQASTNYGTFALGTNAIQTAGDQQEVWNPQGVQTFSINTNGTTLVSNAIARTYFAATNMFILASTNYVAANFTPVAGKMILVPSNQVIYGVSVTKTSIVVDLR